MLTWPVRTVVRLVATPIAVGVLLATLLGLLGGAHWVLDLFANFRMQLLVLAALTLVVVALARGSIGALCAAVALLVNMVLVVPLAFGEQPRPREGGEQITVGSLNVQDRFGDPEGFVEWVGRAQPDIFIVLEASNWTDRIVAQGVAGYEVTRVPDERRADVLVLSRVPVEVNDARAARLPETSAEITFDLDGEAVHMLAIHTISPQRPWRADRRDRALLAAKRWARDATDPVILIGDFNATPWSAPFRDMMEDARLRNSLEGFGVQATWPQNFMLAGIPIDQIVFSRQLTATDRWTGPGFGSSHRSVTATIAFAE